MPDTSTKNSQPPTAGILSGESSSGSPTRWTEDNWNGPFIVIWRAVGALETLGNIYAENEKQQDRIATLARDLREAGHHLWDELMKARHGRDA